MSTIDEVKARLDIVEVVGGYVKLQKAGRYFKGLCPFHSEKTPSFVVYPERQSWHCFGACGTGGDVISFISRKESLEFGDTLRLLAERAGVEMPSFSGKKREEIKTLHDANEAAALYFHSLLVNASPARAYIEERGLDAQAIGDFLIGYAPPGWDGLRNHLTKRGFSEAQLIEAGLLIEGERGAYDRFRNRIMFPIRDERGRVAGFGGRVLPREGPGDDGPKYMNTPQSPIFDKGGLLYGLDRAREAIRQAGTAVIVEGYMDVIAAHQHGQRNVVASMGTALTERQAAQVQRLVRTGDGRVVLAMDSDDAGSAANLRGVQVVASATARGSGAHGPRRPLDIRVLALPQGKDPDELIRADPEAWPKAVAEARPVVDHLLAVLSASLDLSQPRDRSELVAEVLPVIAEVDDPVLQAHYLQRLSRLARTGEDALRRQMPRRQRQVRRRGAEDDAAPDEAAQPAPRRRYRDLREEYCLAMLFQKPEVARLADDLDEGLFSISENRELFRRWRSLSPLVAESGDDEDWLREHYDEVMATRLPFNETAEVEAAFVDCVARLQQARMKAVKEASALALAEGEAGVHPGQVASIARAKLEADGAEVVSQDAQLETLASLLLQDTKAGQDLFRPITRRADGPGSRSSQQTS